MNSNNLTFDKNKLYKTPSGLGGIYTLKYSEKIKDKFIFKPINKDFENIILSLTAEEAIQQIKEA